MRDQDERLVVRRYEVREDVFENFVPLFHLRGERGAPIGPRVHFSVIILVGVGGVGGVRGGFFNSLKQAPFTHLVLVKEEVEIILDRGIR